MSRTKCAVCLLAFAGSAICYFSFRPSHAKPLYTGKKASLAAVQRARSFSVPAIFEPAPGHVEDGVQFVGRGNGIAVLLDGEGMVFSLARAAGHGTDAPNGHVRVRVVSASTSSKRWKKVSPNGSNHSGGRKKGSHSSGWRKRSRPQHWRNLRSGNSRTGSHTKKSAKPIAWQGSAKLRANYFIGNDRSRWRTNVPLYAAAEAKISSPAWTWSFMAMAAVLNTICGCSRTPTLPSCGWNFQVTRGCNLPRMAILVSSPQMAASC